MKSYILDTSALLAYIENEPGVEDVEGLLLKALEDKANVLVSIVSLIEIYYISLQEQDKETSDERLELLKELPLRHEYVTEGLIKIIGEIKATKSMSFVDCCIAGLAKQKRALLVHKDPEYEQIEDQVKQLKLPYKRKTRSKK